MDANPICLALFVMVLFLFQGHVFLETFDPADYYPMSLNPVRPGALTVSWPEVFVKVFMKLKLIIIHGATKIMCM